MRIIRFERLRRGWNQTQLGRRARLSQQSISFIETGRLIPTSDELARLAHAFGLTAAALIRPHVVVVDPETSLSQRQQEQEAAR